MAGQLMRNLFLLALLLCSAAANPQGGDWETFNVIPKNGYVPTAVVAKEIALAVLKPVYGAQVLAQEKPFRVKLKKGVWYVRGFLPRGTYGGVAYIKISKKTGAILQMGHGK